MKRHSTDLVSVIFGVIFLAIAGWWLLGRYVNLNVPHGGWVLAGALILVGLLGVVGSLRGDRNGDRNGDRTREPAYVAPIPTTTSPADATMPPATTTETVTDATAARSAASDPTARDWSPTDWTARDPTAPAGEPPVEPDAPSPGTGDRGY